MRAIERWNPFQELETMRDWMDRWMGRDEDFFRPLSASMITPAVDLVETDKGYEMHASLPGFKPEEVDINLDKDMLTIKAQHEEKEEKKEKNYIYRERRSGSFYRTIRLPEQVDPEKVEAHVDKGILTVILPRLPQAQIHKIPVKVTDGKPEAEPAK